MIITIVITLDMRGNDVQIDECAAGGNTFAVSAVESFDIRVVETYLRIARY
jgi:hypothetical protein